MISVTPRMMPSVPSVTMNGAMRSRVVRKPLHGAPEQAGQHADARCPPESDAPRSIAMVPSTPPIARIAPTERSMPPAMMIIVMPSDMMLITAVCRTTLDRLVLGQKMRRGDGQRHEQNDQAEERQQPLHHAARPSPSSAA